MKDHLENAVVRGFRAALAAVLALALALPVGGLTTLSAFADEPAQNAAEATPGDADGNAAGDADIKIAVLSDTHYYPLTYVSDCEDYETYVGGDPKMLEESGSILDAALDMVRQDQPDMLLVSGDLTKDGEKLGHEQLAERFQKIEDETNTEVFVINGNHDIYNYQDSCTFANGKKESAETTTPDEFKEIFGTSATTETGMRSTSPTPTQHPASRRAAFRIPSIWASSPLWQSTPECIAPTPTPATTRTSM